VTGPALFVVGAIGLAVGAFYTLLKARALGDLAVFLDFGLLGGAGAWIVQTGRFSWLPVLWTAPMALLVIAILHANNWRDIRSDGERRVTTVAGRLGDRGSLVYYGCLIFGPVVIDLVFIGLPRVAGGPLRPMPWTFLLVLLALPNALRLWGRARRRASPRAPLDFVILDGATARHNLVFGLLSTAAVVLEGLLKWG
jgi:1,4-dihydroxy-2-naphthoate octaprenyltransferase